MALTRLGLYNLALVEGLGERPLDSLSEDSHAKRVFDAIWTAGNGTNPYIRGCLEQGYWNFGVRTVKLDSDTSVDTQFGYSYAFAIPTDFVKLVSIASDEYFNAPLNEYEIEKDRFYSDTDPLYLRFISDDDDYGGDLSQWPQSFITWVAHDLALRAAPTIKSSLDLERLEKRVKDKLKIARSNDAQQEPTRFPPLGTWASARLGRRGSAGRADGGSRSTLIG